MTNYTRVTEVLYPFSGLSKIDPDVLKRAADRGTRVHNACNAIIENLGYFDEEDTQGYIESFAQWKEGKFFLSHPGRWNCDKYLITGECDGIYTNETGYTLFDLKTPTKESVTWKLQGSAYSYLAKTHNLTITKIEFVKLSKIGKKPVSYFYEEDFETFLQCLNVYRLFFMKQRLETELDYL